jgi:hypothetical protein
MYASLLIFPTSIVIVKYLKNFGVAWGWKVIYAFFWCIIYSDLCFKEFKDYVFIYSNKKLKALYCVQMLLYAATYLNVYSLHVCI